MEETTKRTLIKNLTALALADGTLDPAEREFIRRFQDRMEIPAEDARAWIEEARREGLKIEPLADRADAEAYVKVMIGLAAADRQFVQAEKNLLAMTAKSCGLTRAELIRLLRENWNEDVIEALEVTRRPALPPEAAELALAAITDHFESLEAFLEAHAGFNFAPIALDAIEGSGLDPRFAIFHAAEELDTSLRALEAIRRALPRATPVFVARRDQAFQIRYLMEAGIRRCVVEPVFPNELADMFLDG